MDKFDWQAALWSVPEYMGLAWSLPCSVLAFAAAVIMFLRTVLHERWSPILFFRSMYIFGLMLIAVSPLNSGWQRWIEPAFAISGFGMAVLYFFNLHRENESMFGLFKRLVRVVVEVRRPLASARSVPHKR